MMRISVWSRPARVVPSGRSARASALARSGFALRVRSIPSPCPDITRPSKEKGPSITVARTRTRTDRSAASVISPVRPSARGSPSMVTRPPARVIWPVTSGTLSGPASPSTRRSAASIPWTSTGTLLRTESGRSSRMLGAGTPSPRSSRATRRTGDWRSSTRPERASRTWSRDSSPVRTSTRSNASSASRSKVSPTATPSRMGAEPNRLTVAEAWDDPTRIQASPPPPLTLARRLRSSISASRESAASV